MWRFLIVSGIFRLKGLICIIIIYVKGHADNWHICCKSKWPSIGFMAIAIHEKVINKKSLVSFYYMKQEFSALKYNLWLSTHKATLTPHPSLPKADCEIFYNQIGVG